MSSPQIGTETGRRLTTYAWLKAVREAPKAALDFGARGTLALLSTWMDDSGGSCYPSLPTIAAGCGLSKAQAARHVTSAVQAGYLRREGGNSTGKSTRYYAVLPAGVGMPTDATEPVGGAPVSRLTDETPPCEKPVQRRRTDETGAAHRCATTNPVPTQGEPLKRRKSSGGQDDPKPSPAASAPPRPTPPVSAPLPVTEHDGWLEPMAMRCTGTGCSDYLGRERADAGWTTCGPCSADELRFDPAAPQRSDPWLREGPAFGRVG